MENSIAIISGFFAILGIVIGYFIGAKKYAFEKIYEQKLICIKELHKQAVKLEFMFNEYVYTIGPNPTKELMNQKREKLKEVEINFRKLKSKFREEEIILDESTANQINSFLDICIQIISNLIASIISQNLTDQATAYKQFEISRKLISQDLLKIEDNLKEEFRRTLKIRSWRRIFYKLLGL